MKTLLMSALMLSTTILGAAPAFAQTAPIKNIVLVHGAFVDETSWNGVAAILTARATRLRPSRTP